jgi:hypothetical protein
LLLLTSPVPNLENQGLHFLWPVPLNLCGHIPSSYLGEPGTSLPLARTP